MKTYARHESTLIREVRLSLSLEIFFLAHFRKQPELTVNELRSPMQGLFLERRRTERLHNEHERMHAWLVSTVVSVRASVRLKLANSQNGFRKHSASVEQCFQGKQEEKMYDDVLAFRDIFYKYSLIALTITPIRLYIIF